MSEMRTLAVLSLLCAHCGGGSRDTLGPSGAKVATFDEVKAGERNSAGDTSSMLVVSGRVVDSRFHEPVQATVEYVKRGGGSLGGVVGEALTDSAGRFTVRLERAGRYFVQVRVAGQVVAFVKTLAPAPDIEIVIDLPRDYTF